MLDGQRYPMPLSVCEVEMVTGAAAPEELGKFSLLLKVRIRVLKLGFELQDWDFEL